MHFNFLGLPTISATNAAIVQSEHAARAVSIQGNRCVGTHKSPPMSEKREKQDALIPVWRIRRFLFRKEKYPMLHRKPHIEHHLKSTIEQLAERIERMTTHGVANEVIKKDHLVRHLEANIRQAKRQLGAIAALETHLVEKAETRIRKETDAKSEKMHGKSKKKNRDAPPVKKRKKRRIDIEDEARAE